MTAETMAKPAGRPAHASFANVISSEWTKILTVKSTFWTLLAGIVVTVGLSVLLALAFVSSYDQMTAEDRADFDPAAFGLVGTNFGMVAFGVLGVMVISAEYTTGMIRTALIAMPRRIEYLAAKALVLGVVVLIVAEVVSFASFFLSQLVYGSKDLDASITDENILRAVVGGGLYLTLIALFALSVGALLRHTAGAVTTVLGVLFVLPIIGGFLPGDWGNTVNKFLPSNAGAQIMSARQADDALGPWTGFGVFAIYTAVVLVVAVALFQKRDA